MSHADTRTGETAPVNEEYPEEGKHASVILAGLVLVALICFLVMRLTINMMAELPPTAPQPSTERSTR